MGQDIPFRQIAVYLHIPFCLSRCGYCSFFSVPFSKTAKTGYLRYLQQEIDLYLQDDPSFQQARTLYFGGGTPSLLSSDEINSLCSNFHLTPDAEISLEINPLQITEEYLKELRKTPVNRLSIGVQSMNDSDLRFLDRRHRSAQIPAKIRLCREYGYHNLSLDLIYGLPGSTVSSLNKNLEQFISLAPEHVSCYLLTLDEDSALGIRMQSDPDLALPEDEILAAQYHSIRETLITAGFEHYEISNFSRPGKASQHNLAYWKSESWLGLGASASGWLPPFRYTNPADLSAYYGNINAGNLKPDAQVCSLEQTKADYIMMALRLIKGIHRSAYQERFGSDIYAEKGAIVDKLISQGWLQMDPAHLKLSSAALFVSNAVIGELL